MDGFHPVHYRHAEIQQQYVGAVQEKLLNRLLAVRAFAHNLHIFLERDHRIRPFADNGMIIRNDYADLFDESRLGFLFHWEAVGGHGTVTATRVPFPGWLFSSSLPPISSVRSRMPGRPNPRLVSLTSNPCPSSTIVSCAVIPS